MFVLVYSATNVGIHYKNINNNKKRVTFKRVPFYNATVMLTYVIRNINCYYKLLLSIYLQVI